MWKPSSKKDGTLLNSIHIPDGTTNLYVISHGWNNNHQDAQNLYRNFFTNFKEVAPTRTRVLGGRKFAITGVIWPSEGFDEVIAVESRSEAAGGGVSLFIGDSIPDAKSEQALFAELDRMKSFFSQPAQQLLLEDVKALIPDLETKRSVREEFVQKIRSLLNREAANKEDASNIFFRVAAEEIMEQLRISEEDAETEIVSGGGTTFLGSGASRCQRPRRNWYQ